MKNMSAQIQSLQHIRRIRNNTYILVILPKAILYHSIPACSPTGTGVVTFKQEGWIIPAELFQQAAILGTKKS